MSKTRKWLCYALLAIAGLSYPLAVLARSAFSNANDRPKQVQLAIVDVQDAGKIEYKQDTNYESSNTCADVESFFDSYGLTASQTKILSKIASASCAAGIDEYKAVAIGYAESHFTNKCNTTSCAYGIGPLQIIQSTFNSFKCAGSVYNADDNIICGVRIMKDGGFGHWGTQDTWWGSYRTWHPLYLKIKQTI